MSYNSRVTYTGDGSTTQFSVPFAYLAKSDVKCYVDGSAVSFSWVTDSTIQCNSAPSDGLSVQIKRETAYSVSVVDFTGGSVLLSSDLDLANMQLLYVMQEVRDDFSETEDKVDNVSLTSGNVPAPAAGDVGKYLKATAAGIYMWGDLTSLTLSGNITVEGVLAGSVNTSGDITAGGAIRSSGIISTTSNISASQYGGKWLYLSDLTSNTTGIHFGKTDNPANFWQLYNTIGGGQLVVSWTGLNLMSFDVDETTGDKFVTLSVPPRPSETGSVDMGRTTQKWRDIYASRYLHVASTYTTRWSATGSTTMANEVVVQLTFTNTSFGVDDMSSGASSSQIIIKTSGTYLVSAFVNLSSTADGGFEFDIRKNGSTIVSDFGALVPNGYVVPRVVVMLPLVIGDVLDLTCNQSSGQPATATAASFSAFRLSD